MYCVYYTHGNKSNIMEHAAQCLQADKERVLFWIFIKKSSVLVQCVMSDDYYKAVHFFNITAPKQEWRTSSFYSRPKHKLPEW